MVPFNPSWVSPLFLLHIHKYSTLSTLSFPCQRPFFLCMSKRCTGRLFSWMVKGGGYYLFYILFLTWWKEVFIWKTLHFLHFFFTFFVELYSSFWVDRLFSSICSPRICSMISPYPLCSLRILYAPHVSSMHFHIPHRFSPGPIKTTLLLIPSPNNGIP